MSKPLYERFPEIEGLRAYLAVWVFLGHGLLQAGFLAGNPLVRLLLHGGDAVHLFVVVSGFVITHLLLGKQESYPAYIIRRFFRIYPVYVVSCVIGYFAIGTYAEMMQEVAWYNMTGWPEYQAAVAAMSQGAQQNFWSHFALHAVMLHGLVPNEVLPYAPMVFLPAAWSISLEWQFYLIAPFIILAIGRVKEIFVLLASFGLIYVAYRCNQLGTYPAESSLIMASGFFALGILCRVAYSQLSRYTVNPLLASATVAFLALFFIKESFLVIAIWATFYSYLLWGKQDRILGPLVTRLMTARPIMLVGAASYSLYLVHRPIQIWLGKLAIAYNPNITHLEMLGVAWGAVLVVIPLSLLLYFGLERPGISLGKKLAARFKA